MSSTPAVSRTNITSGCCQPIHNWLDQHPTIQKAMDLVIKILKILGIVLSLGLVTYIPCTAPYFKLNPEPLNETKKAKKDTNQRIKDVQSRTKETSATLEPQQARTSARAIPGLSIWENIENVDAAARELARDVNISEQAKTALAKYLETTPDHPPEFELPEAPGIVFKRSKAFSLPGVDDRELRNRNTDNHFFHMILAKSMCNHFKYKHIFIPGACVISVRIRGDEYKFIAQNIPEYIGGLRRLYRDSGGRLTEHFQELFQFFMNGKFGTFNYKNIPLCEDKKIAILDCSTMREGRGVEAIFGYDGPSNTAIVNLLFNKEHLKMADEFARSVGGDYSNTLEKQSKEIDRLCVLEAWYREKKITRLFNQPVVTPPLFNQDWATVDLDPISVIIIRERNEIDQKDDGSQQPPSYIENKLTVTQCMQSVVDVINSCIESAPYSSFLGARRCITLDLREVSKDLLEDRVKRFMFLDKQGQHTDPFIGHDRDIEPQLLSKLLTLLQKKGAIFSFEVDTMSRTVTIQA